MFSLLSSVLAFSSAALAEEAPAEPTFSQKYAAPSPVDPTSDIRHGLRLGYVYAEGARRAGLDSNHLFAMGWEANFRIAGNDTIDFLVVPNVMVLGVNQGLFIPSGNLLVGASLGHFFEVGAGANLTLGTEQPLHMVMAVGITPRVGELQVPISLSYIPDNDGNFRAALTTGVNWGMKAK